MDKMAAMVAKWLAIEEDGGGVASEGREMVLLTGVEGVLGYSEEEIRVKLRCGVMRVWGEGMTMRAFHTDRVAIEGKWRGAEWEEKV